MTDVSLTSSDAERHASTELALLRTCAAIDRTLLAWVRTSFALQGFGFTLATYVAKWIEDGAVHDVRPSLPRNLGLTLLAAGVLAMLGGAIEYRRALHRIGRVSHVSRWSFALVLAILMFAIGAVVFVGLLLKSGSM